jgi:hypothetical protein
LVQKKVDLHTQFQCIHTLQFMSLCASEQTLPISHIKKSRPNPHTHLFPIQEKAKRRCRSNAILARDHRTHPDTQINLNKRDLQLALRPRKLLKYRLDHPARRTRRGREHNDDGAMGAQ